MPHLPGLTAREPVNMLAGIGLFEALTHARRTKPTMRWAYGADDELAPDSTAPTFRVAHLRIETRGTLAEIAETVAAQAAEWLALPLLADAPSTLRVTPAQALPWISAVVATGDGRQIRQLRGMIDVDPTEVSSTGRLRRTALDFTGGLTRFIDAVRGLAKAVTAADIYEAISEEFPSDPEAAGRLPSLRWWRGSLTVPGALSATPPGELPPQRRPGIEWLAWLGLHAYPVRQVAITDRLAWPVWNNDLTHDQLLPVIAAAATSGILIPPGTAEPGGTRVWSAPISWPGHRYGQFGPPAVERRDASEVGSPAWSDPAKPVGISEIAQHMRTRRETVQTWAYRGLLPAARWAVGGKDAWALIDIQQWAWQTGRAIEPPYPGADEYDAG